MKKTYITLSAVALLAAAVPAFANESYVDTNASGTYVPATLPSAPASSTTTAPSSSAAPIASGYVENVDNKEIVNPNAPYTEETVIKRDANGKPIKKTVTQDGKTYEVYETETVKHYEARKEGTKQSDAAQDPKASTSASASSTPASTSSAPASTKAPAKAAAAKAETKAGAAAPASSAPKKADGSKASHNAVKAASTAKAENGKALPKTSAAK